jgi:ribosomal protein L7/L12
MNSFTIQAMDLSRSILVCPSASMTRDMREQALRVLEEGHLANQSLIVIADFSIERDDHAKMQHLVSSGRKIPAIKYLRHLTGLSLRDAKNAVENKMFFLQPNEIVEPPA